MKTVESNFSFLKEINKNIFKIIKEAEGLYRDEYFQQCMTQTRCFAENVCRELLNGNVQPNDTFDTMLANLDDYLINCTEKREIISDLYFLKKAGNQSVHTRAVDKDGIKALECMQRSFEVAVMFYSAKNGQNPNVARLLFDEELLVTGKRSELKNTLKEKYLQKKAKNDEIARREKVQNGTETQRTTKPKKRKTSKFDRYPHTQKSSAKPFLTNTRKIKFIIFAILLALSFCSLLIVKILLTID